ncbi:MAG: AsmA-like C-terminal region-containing protein [Clostridiaceae bacterium]|jgi:hypothetical protein|nr:AsmA-like C-terminal region-containing protein [Clostridiaceae bacterium]
MKIFLKVFGYSILVAVIAAYCAFMFVLPGKINLTPYKIQLQQLAKEQARLDVNFENFKVVASPSLSLGISADDISVKLPDGSDILSADKLQARVSIPALLLLQAKVNYAQIDNLKLNLDIKDGKQYKIVLLIQDIINDNKKNETQEVEKPETSKIEELQQKYAWFNPEWITINVPDLKIKNYELKVDDPHSGHYLLIKGDKLDAGYKSTVLGTKQHAKLKTLAEFYSDNSKNITADIDWKTFLPNISKTKDTEDDPAEYVEFPFVNPVLTYRNYNFKTNISSKLNVKDKDNHIKSKGYLYLDNMSMNVKGLKLPTGTIHIDTDGTSADVNTDFYVANNSNISINAKADYGEKKSLDADIVTDKIYFNDLILLAKGILNTMQIHNNLSDLKAAGYIQANTDIHTDFKKLKSDGCIIARNGVLVNKRTGKIFDRGNLNFIFANNMFVVKKSHLFVGNAPIKIAGMIDNNSNLDFFIKSGRIPLTAVYSAFAPHKVKRNYRLTSGNGIIDFALRGTLGSAVADLKLLISNVNFAQAKRNFVISNGKLNVNAKYDFKELNGKIHNENLRISIPKTSSVITNPKIDILINPDDILLKNSQFKINRFSTMTLNAKIDKYFKKPKIDVLLGGKIYSGDIQHFVPINARSYFDAKGSIPVKLSYKGDLKRREMIVQALATSGNYITPIEIKNIMNRPSILQSRIIFKKNRLNIKDTGLFSNSSSSLSSSDLMNNFRPGRKIFTVSGTIVNLNTAEPFINILRIQIPSEINASIFKFKNSSMRINGNLLAFGRSAYPVVRGNFAITKVSLPNLFVTIDGVNLHLLNKTLRFSIDNMLFNKTSDMSAKGIIDLNRLPKIFIKRIIVKSNNFDVDKFMKFPEGIQSVVNSTPSVAKPKTVKTVDTDFPIVIRNGHVRFNKIKTGDIILDDTTGKLEYVNNIVYLTNLLTSAMKGNVKGNITVNVNDNLIGVKLKGSNIDAAYALWKLCKMKHTLTGKVAFDTDLTFNGGEYKALVKSIKGRVSFIVKNGQFGSFGRFENFLLAENIRESEFFKTTIGGIINSMVTIDTSHFDTLAGNLEFKNGIVDVKPVTSSGNVMTLYIFGKYDILANTSDLKVRGRLASMVSNVLGPLAQLNPINIVKATPGVNYLLLKAFSVFCEQVTPQEMAAIPEFPKGYDNAAATKFQIIVKGKNLKTMNMVKSFKWLAVVDDINNAQHFMDTLPPPTLDANGNLVLSDPNAVQAPPKPKTPMEKLKNFFSKFKKDKKAKIRK